MKTLHFIGMDDDQNRLLTTTLSTSYRDCQDALTTYALDKLDQQNDPNLDRDWSADELLTYCGLSIQQIDDALSQQVLQSSPIPS